MKVRYAEYEDLKEIAKITMDCYMTTYAEILPKEYLDSLDVDELIASYKIDFDRLSFIVVTDDNDDIRGCAIFGDNRKPDKYPQYDCELYCIYVDPTRHFQGYGKQLIGFAKSELRKQHKKKMLLWVFKDNLPAVAFYLRLKGEYVDEEILSVSGKTVIESGYGYTL